MSQLEELRRLILASEITALQRLAAEIDSLRTAEASLAERLPELLEKSQQAGHSEQMSRVLAPLVEVSLVQSVQSRPESLVTALFPIIGPSIRRAIAESLRALAEDINRSLENSFSLRGLKWRVEAWRTGIPFSQIVLRNNLHYEIDHAFLIERESGLLLHRYSSEKHANADVDAIAGMLTAIGDFVNDSVGDLSNAGQGLSEASVGEHLLLVHQGPLAVLACFVRGTPTPELGTQLQELLERVHQAPGFAKEDKGDLWRKQYQPALNTIVSQAATRAAEATARARWPVRLLVGVGLLSLALLLHGEWQVRETSSLLKARIADEPGWELLDLRRSSYRLMHLRILRDPDASPADLLLSIAQARNVDTRVQESRYLSLDPEVVLRRATRVLAKPDSVALELTGSHLRVSGEADEQWRESVRVWAKQVPGIDSIDVTNLIATQGENIIKRLKKLASRIEQRNLTYAQGSTTFLDDDDTLDSLASDIKEALMLSDLLGIPNYLLITGTSDRAGSERINAPLRQLRAQSFATLLSDRNVPSLRITVHPDGRSEQDAPSVLLELISVNDTP